VYSALSLPRSLRSHLGVPPRRTGIPFERAVAFGPRRRGADVGLYGEDQSRPDQLAFICGSLMPRARAGKVHKVRKCEPGPPRPTGPPGQAGPATGVRLVRCRLRRTDTREVANGLARRSCTRAALASCCEIQTGQGKSLSSHARQLMCLGDHRLRRRSSSKCADRRRLEGLGEW
jgi:hypothetical protein